MFLLSMDFFLFTHAVVSVEAIYNIFGYFVFTNFTVSIYIEKIWCIQILK